MKAEPLQIRDKRFLINRLIQQAPKSTLIRAFFKNADENAVVAPADIPLEERVCGRDRHRHGEDDEFIS